MTLYAQGRRRIFIRTTWRYVLQQRQIFISDDALCPRSQAISICKDDALRRTAPDIVTRHLSLTWRVLSLDIDLGLASKNVNFFEEEKEVIRFRFLLITPGKEGAKTPQPPTTDKTKKKKSRAYMQDIESLLFFYVDMY